MILSSDFGYYRVIALWFLWGLALLVLSLRGSQQLYRQSEGDGSFFGRYSRFVSYWMLFIALGLCGMMMLVLFAVLDRPRRVLVTSGSNGSWHPSGSARQTVILA